MKEEKKRGGGETLLYSGKSLLGMIILSICYFIMAKIGLQTQAVSGFATLLWAPTGIAIAALWKYGYRLWPGIAVAAFAVNLFSGASFLAAFGIALGNTLESVAAVYLLRRFVGFENPLHRVQNLIKFIFLAAMVSPLISATLGVTSLWLEGIVLTSLYAKTWLAWWLGDFFGALIVGSLLIKLFEHKINFRPSAINWLTIKWLKVINWRKIIELTALILLSIFLINFVYFGDLVIFKIAPLYSKQFQYFLYLLFIPLIWAALRFNILGVTIINLSFFIISIWFTFQGVGPFVEKTLELSLFEIEIFVGVASITALLLAAAVRERKLSEEDRAKRIMDHSFEGIIIVDPRQEHVITYVNRAWERMTGWKSKEVVGKKSPRILKSGKMNPLFYKELWETISRGGLFQREIVNKKKDGTLYDAELNIYPIITADGNKVYVEISRDISNRKKLEADQENAQKKITQTNEKLKQLNELKDLFLMTTSHELKTPLTPILIQAQLLLDGSLGKLSGEQKKCADTIVRNMKNLNRLITNILEYSVIQAKELRVQFEKKNISSLIREAVNDSKPLADMKRILIKTTLSSLPSFLFDENLIREVLTNLIDNAIKFTADGGKISIEALKVRDHVLVNVGDTGRGISAKEIALLFKPFSQVGAKSMMKHSGTGLGLAICKGIITAHHGTIGVNSELGKGSTFFFTLPLHQKKI